MTADLAFSIAMFAGWLFLVVALTWPEPHCSDCPNHQRYPRRKK